MSSSSAHGEWSEWVEWVSGPMLIISIPCIYYLRGGSLGVNCGVCATSSSSPHFSPVWNPPWFMLSGFIKHLDENSHVYHSACDIVIQTWLRQKKKKKTHYQNSEIHVSTPKVTKQPKLITCEFPFSFSALIKSLVPFFLRRSVSEVYNSDISPKCDLFLMRWGKGNFWAATLVLWETLKKAHWSVQAIPHNSQTAHDIMWNTLAGKGSATWTTKKKKGNCKCEMNDWHNQNLIPSADGLRRLWNCSKPSLKAAAQQSDELCLSSLWLNMRITPT